MATSNAATTYLENKLLAYIFKNDSLLLVSGGQHLRWPSHGCLGRRKQGLSQKPPSVPMRVSK